MARLLLRVEIVASDAADSVTFSLSDLDMEGVSTQDGQLLSIYGDQSGQKIEAPIKEEVGRTYAFVVYKDPDNFIRPEMSDEDRLSQLEHNFFPGSSTETGSAKALGDDIEPLSLYYDYSPDKGYTNYPNDTESIRLSWGQGYWLYLSEDTKVAMTADVPYQGRTLEFSSEGWHLIGVPYEVDWSQVNFSDPNDFANDGAGNVRLVSWNPKEGKYLNHYTDTTYILSPWAGYWIYVNQAPSDEPASLTISKTSVAASSLGTQTPLPQSVDRDQPDYPPLPQEIEDNFKALAYPNLVMEKDKVTLATQTAGVEKIKVTVTNAAGEQIYNSGYESGNKLAWDLKNASGKRVANGIYLYKVQATRTDGTTQISGVKRLLVLR